MEYIFNNNKYIIEKDANVIFNYEELKEKITDYFLDYDYILGDMSYNKIRLKGFNDPENKKCTKINDINNLETYLKDYCAYGCKYFLLKKLK